MNTKKIYKIVGIDNYGNEYALTKKDFSTASKAHNWISENQNSVKLGYKVKEVNIITPEEAKEE